LFFIISVLCCARCVTAWAKGGPLGEVSLDPGMAEDQLDAAGVGGSLAHVGSEALGA